MNSIFLLILLFSLTNCLKSNDFCELSIKKYNECNGSFSFKCATAICSKQETVCFEYKKIIENIQLYSAKNETIKYLKEMIKYQVAQKNIKKCESIINSK